jgi:hypothetical protein
MFSVLSPATVTRPTAETGADVNFATFEKVVAKPLDKLHEIRHTKSVERK